MELDYTKWPAGVALAKDVVLEACPKCGASCHLQTWVGGKNPKTVFVHVARIRRTEPKRRDLDKNDRGGPFKRRNPRQSTRAKNVSEAVRWCEQ